MWNPVSSTGHRDADYREALEASSDCVLMIDRDRRVVEANEAAIDTFGGSMQHGSQRIGGIKIEWLITDMANHYVSLGESVESFLDSHERHLSVIARRLDGMKFHATVRIVPTEQDSIVSHILYLRGASERGVF